MLFNSLEFAIFLPLVFLLYWTVGSHRLKEQNIILLLASYVFYGWWDWRFLSLIIFSSSLDFFISQALSKSHNLTKRKILLWTSILVNLGLLALFKYYNFFVESFVGAFSFLGYPMNISMINIILPVGISFYTFQTLSYTIDVYRGKLTASGKAVDFFAFVSFFPQLVAGPIERASNLLPQFQQRRRFDYAMAVDGLRQILWGLFKKIVIADNCAEIVNEVFQNHDHISGPVLIWGVILFAFQIYGDFSGYSDIAIGTARLFGFNLMQNFAYPYFSRDIAEFWRRWHISLSTWFRDYLYIPLGGSKGSLLSKIRNIFIIFIVSGFWHGANWTFIVWGALHAFYYLPLMLSNKNRMNTDELKLHGAFYNLKLFFHILITFSLTCFAWIFFRAVSLEQAFAFILNIAENINLNPGRILLYIFDPLTIWIIILLAAEWNQRESQHGLFFTKQQDGTFWSRVKRNSIYYSLAIMIILEIPNVAASFIYFQF